MNMRYKGYIWWAWLLLLLFSCTESEQVIEPVNPGEVRMSMNISTRATSDPEVLNVNETRISRLRIYVFDGTSLDKMYYWQGLTATDGTYTTPVFTVKAATGKTLYAIVNEPVDFDTRAILESVDHPDDLVDVQYQMADYLSTETNVARGRTTEYCLPMYGELAGVDAAEGTTQTVSMRVDRAVARVDVYMRTEAGYFGGCSIPSSLIVTGFSRTGFVSPKKIGSNPSPASNEARLRSGTFGNIPEESPSGSDKGMLVFSFYIPEMECRNHKLTMGIDGYDAIELGGDSNNSGGAPLEKLERNHVYQVLCRFMQKTVSLEIDLTVCPWIALEPQVEEVKDDIYITNSYVVPPGGRVHIPTDGVYKAWAQMDEFGHTPVPEGEVTAEVLWQDGMGVMTEHSVKVMNAEKRDKAYIVVETGDKAGNAVVAMKVNGEIYWSWHIWCTDYNPNLKEGQQEFNGFVWMDRNLGALRNDYSEDGRVKGLLYQWGRKDPFPNTDDWRYGENPYPEPELYDISGNVKKINKSEESSYSRLDLVRNPMNFYLRSWSDGGGLPSLWNSTKGQKTINDPCPAGWRVVVTADDKSPWEVGYYLPDYANLSIWGIVFPDTNIYYPAAGYREDDGSAVSPQCVFFYWTGNRLVVGAQWSYVRCLEGWKTRTGLSLSYTNRTKKVTRGGSIRCVKE